MKYNSSDNTNNGNNIDNKKKSNCGMNEVDTEASVEWPSWCYTGKVHIFFLFLRIHFLVFFLFSPFVQVQNFSGMLFGVLKTERVLKNMNFFWRIKKNHRH